MQTSNSEQLKVLASKMREEDSQAPVRPSNPKRMPSLTELKRRVAGESDAFSRSGKSDASSGSGKLGFFVGADGELAAKRKADSIDGPSNNEDGEEFYDCEDDDRPVRIPGVAEPPSKKKSERETARLIAKVNGKARLRYWDSADHLAIH